MLLTSGATDAVSRTALLGMLRHLAASTGASVFYAAVLWYSYVHYVSPTFGYEGLTYRSPNPSGWVIAVALVAAVSSLLPWEMGEAGRFFVWTFWVIAGAPAILLAQLMTNLTSSEATIFGVVVALSMVMLRILVAVGPRISPTFLPEIDSGLVWGLLVGICVLTYALLVAVAGLQIRLLSLTAVYDVRSSFSQSAAEIPLVGYLLPVVANVINPVFFARGLATRSPGWVLAGVGGQVLIYTTTGQKAVLFSILALVAVAFLFRSDERPSGRRLLAGTFYVIALAIALDTILRSALWNSLLIRRFLIIPGSLAVDYVSVFRDRAHGEFRGTPLFWLDPVYARGPSYIVGESLTGNTQNNANVSFIGHGFFNLGYTGVFIEAFVAALFVWLLTVACQGLPPRIAAMAVVMSAFAVGSTNIFTVLTSHGGVAAIMVCALLPREGWAPRRSKKSGPRAESSIDDRAATQEPGNGIEGSHHA